VAFGKDPYVKRGVAVYREQSQGAFGMQIAKFGSDIKVNSIQPVGAVAEEGSVRKEASVSKMKFSD
jgi:hypothetical protein